jgi:hypothetical protein
MREPSTEHARNVLLAQGFHVEDIPEAQPDKRADLLATFGSERYLIEAKLRKPHSAWQEMARRSTSEAGGMTERVVVPWNALSSTIMEAYAQLTATPAGPEVFRILWLVAPHHDDTFVISCLEKRLLGTELLLAVNPERPQDDRVVECYYHSQNDFVRCPELDAAVLGTVKGVKLLLNTFGIRKGTFRDSHLYKVFQAGNAVIDPELEESTGNAFMIGADFEGVRDGTSQWKYLLARHDCGTNVTVETDFAAMISIPLALFGTSGDACD